MPQVEVFFGTIRRYFKDYMTAMGQRGAFGQLVHKASRDDGLRRRLIQAPNEVLAEAGVKLPEGTKVEVFANTDKMIHLILPPLVEANTSKKDT